MISFIPFFLYSILAALALPCVLGGASAQDERLAESRKLFDALDSGSMDTLMKQAVSMNNMEGLKWAESDYFVLLTAWAKRYWFEEVGFETVRSFPVVFTLSEMTRAASGYSRAKPSPHSPEGVLRKEAKNALVGELSAICAEAASVVQIHNRLITERIEPDWTKFTNHAMNTFVIAERVGESGVEFGRMYEMVDIMLACLEQRPNAWSLEGIEAVRYETALTRGRAALPARYRANTQDDTI